MSKLSLGSSLCFSPYNYDMDAMRNLSTGSSGTNADRKSDAGASEEAEIVSIDKYFEKLDKEEALSALNNILDSDITTAEAFSPDLRDQRPETVQGKDRGDLDNRINVVFDASDKHYDPEPDVRGKKFNYLSTGNYQNELNPLHQNDLYYSKPIPIHQIENTVMPKYHDKRVENFNDFYPSNEQIFWREYPRTKNIKNVKNAYPQEKSKSTFQSSPKLSSFRRNYKSRPTHFVPYMRDFNRRKPFRRKRKETYSPRRFDQKGFQKHFHLQGRKG